MPVNDDSRPAGETLPGDVGGNRLLAGLSAPVLARLQPHLSSVYLERRDVLFRSHEPVHAVYFPDTAVVSFLARLTSGDTLEVGLVGRDGMTGNVLLRGAAAMSCDAVVQIPGYARRLNADVLRQMTPDEPLARAAGGFSQLLLAQTMQMCACNVFHAVEQRCIRWLLTVSDLTARDEIPLTHELLATSIGVHRPTVTLVIGTLHRSGAIVEERGRVLLRDRTALEASCCECYHTLRDERRRLLGY
jgi:CRP-like cAMP-binding protein